MLDCGNIVSIFVKYGGFGVMDLYCGFHCEDVFI